MSSVAVYSAMTVFIMSDAELHIFYKFVIFILSLISLLLSRRYKLSKMRPVSVIACFFKDPGEHKERGSESSESRYDSKL